MTKRVTISDIARAAGVSEMTVSRIVNGRAAYRRPTYAKRAEWIRALAARMGYRPNASARAVRQRRCGNIGLLLSTVSERSHLPFSLLHAVEMELAARGYRLTVAMLPDERIRPGFVPQLLREVVADGLLVDYTHRIPEALLELIHASDVPAVWLNVKMPENCVHPDDFGAGRDAARRLLELGHRRLVYADFSHAGSDPERHYSVDDRYAGYAEAMREAGLTPVRFWSETGNGVPTTERWEWAVRLLRSSPRPTAVITYGAVTAVPVFCAARHMGWAIPGDLSLISFDDHPVDYLGPTFSTERVPFDAVGREGVRMLMERITSAGASRKTVAVPFPFDPGETCAPPRPKRRCSKR